MAAHPGRAGVRTASSSCPGSGNTVHRRRTRPARSGMFVAWLMLAPTLAGIIVFFIYPVIANIVLSFTNFSLVGAPRWVGFRNYVYMFTSDDRLVHSVLNTLSLIALVVPARIVAAMVLALLLVRARAASGLLRTVFYLPALLPPVASVTAFVFLLNPATGPVNWLLHSIGLTPPLWFNDPALAQPSLALLAVWVAGDVMIILLAGRLAVPGELYDAAATDGARGLQNFWYVTLPSMSPILVFSTITGVIAGLQYFTEVTIASAVASGRAGVNVSVSQVIGYPNDALLTFAQWLYVRGFANLQLGYTSALSVMLFVVLVVPLFLFARRLQRLLAGGTA